MIAKTLTALITVVAGIGAALVLYWVLNQIAERLPGTWGDRVKPYLFILPAFLAIVVYLVYPAILTVINSFKDNFSRQWIGLTNYRELFTSSAFRGRCSTRCSGSLSSPPRACSWAWQSPCSPTGSAPGARRRRRR